MENVILSHSQRPYGHKGTPYNDWTACRLDLFKGRVLHRLGHGRKGLILGLVYEFLHDQDMVAKGSVPSHTEEIAQLSKLLTSLPPKKAPIELWELMEWSQHSGNAWFTDGSST